ncbi:MAG: hypothetical protein SFX73_35895, partial [Kofleriaceae bacterium]|nr:hypothetical protein [Kofleriaceae bacterium]
MLRTNDHLVLTATDVVNHLACEHLTALDLRDLDAPQPQPETDPTLALLQKKGDAWERTYLDRLRREHGTVEVISRDLARAQAAQA